MIIFRRNFSRAKDLSSTGLPVRTIPRRSDDSTSSSDADEDEEEAGKERLILGEKESVSSIGGGGKKELLPLSASDKFSVRDSPILIGLPHATEVDSVAL